MAHASLDRRQFLRTTTMAAGGLAVLGTPLAAPAKAPAKKTATDWVPLGDSGLKICRLGMGTGSRGVNGDCRILPLQ